MNRPALVLALVFALVPIALAQGNETNSTNTTATPGNATAPTGEPAAPPAPLVIDLVGHDEGGSYFWTDDGKPGHNPTLTVSPGQQVTFHLTSVTGTHNFKIASERSSKAFSEGDPPLDVVWTAPATAGTVPYQCAIHAATMKGTITVGAAAPSGGGGGAGAISGDSVDLGDVGFPQCAGTKVPAIAAQHVTGGPTLEDYAKSCHGEAASTGKERSGADLVIPVSLGLIGVGVLGMVWVHRSYKP